MTDSTGGNNSDNSDPESVNFSSSSSGKGLSGSAGTAANFRVTKKPAPKPPANPNSGATGGNANEGILDSISSSFDSTTSKIRSKIGSLRIKEKPQHPLSQQINNGSYFISEPQLQQQPPRGDSPPVVASSSSSSSSSSASTSQIATVRRNHQSPRGGTVDNTSRSRRPISLCDRPMVPPPSVPPRPSVAERMRVGGDRHSVFDLPEHFNDGNGSHNSIDEDGDDIEEEEEDESSQSTAIPVASLYPRLDSPSESLDSGEHNGDGSNPFTYPCSEFIDERQVFGSDDSLNNAQTAGHELPSAMLLNHQNSNPPQKPPRSSLATHSSSTTLELMASSESVENVEGNLVTPPAPAVNAPKNPPPLPLRPSKSPSPIPPSNQAGHTTPAHSHTSNTLTTSANLLASERTYL